MNDHQNDPQNDSHTMGFSSFKIDAAHLSPGQLASPDAIFQRCLENAARGLCKARGIDAEQMLPYNTGTMAYTTRPAWHAVKDELYNAWLVQQFVRTLPDAF